ncbi:MAG: DNA polymerase III subunit alpha [Bacilli bacterium]|nr:DNA polymerase III subunit alpha [Bacilli bacterium]
MFTSLYVKTNYSLLSSLISIDKLIDTCVKRKIKSVAICDNNMTGVMHFYKSCKKNNIKPIIGLDVTYNGEHILLYAQNYEGYKCLIKLSTISSEREITVEELEKYNNDIIAILPYAHLNIIDEIEPIYPNLYIGYSNIKEEKEIDISKYKKVFINKTLYINKKESEYLKYLFMIKENKTIADNIDFIDNYNYLLGDEVISLSSSEGLSNSNIIADLCNLEFPKNGNLLPIYKTDNNDSDEYLKNLSIKGLNKRLNNNVSEEYKTRLLYELEVINNMGFSNYFLVVYDFIRYAKKENILVGPGRGSAGGSLVAFSLGITDIDPIKYDLLFERFLNPERVTMPDIDTDFPDVYRDQVIDYVKNKYGIKNVSGIITFGTFASRLAIRDVSRVLNIKSNDVDILCKHIPLVTKWKLNDFYKKDNEFRNIIDNDEKLKKMLEIASVIEGFPRHTSMHAAGIVMSRLELDEVIPLVKNNEDLYLTGYSMEYLEELGLLKMDFLGLKNLTTIMNIIRDIEEKEGIKIDFSKIPLDDSEALNIFTKADTSGIFQFESLGMKNFLQNLRPTTFEDIFAAIALFRPGPAVNIDSYIRRKHGKEEIDYIDPSLENILKPTYGIIIYQEQIMQIASLMAGYTLGEADILRRAMSKKKMDILKNEEDKFINGAINRGYNKETAKKVFDLILNFANYGFNRAHSVAYSLIAYKMAYLKAKYPKYFFSNLLTSVIGSEIKTKEYINEAKQRGIKILLPDINKSYGYYTVEQEGIRFPLSNIKNIGIVTCRDIIDKREKCFTDIFDCFSKIVTRNVNEKTIESLILASCFDSFGYNKKTLLNNLDNLLNYASLTKDLDPSLVIKPEIEQTLEFTKETLMLNEKKLFGFYLSEYPTTNYKEQYSTIELCDIKKYFDKTIDTVALIDKIKIIETKNGDKMAFIYGSDHSSVMDYTMFPNVYKENSDLARGDVVLVRGRVEKRLDKYQIIVQKLKKLT